MDEENKWRDRVDARLSNLTASETVQNDRLDDQDEEMATLKHTLEGNPQDRKDNGVVGDVEAHAEDIRMLRAVMLPDALGHGGVINELRDIRTSIRDLKRERKFKWKFYLAVLGVIGLLSREIIHDLPQIKEFFQKGPESRVDKMIDKAKRPRHRHSAPPAEPIDEGADSSLSE